MKSSASSPPASVRRDIVIVAGMLVVLAAPADARAQTRQQTFDIPARPAGEALVQLCLEADCELALVGPARQRTRAVRGRMTWRTALGRMLEGTDLRHRFIGERGVRIWVEPRSSPRAAPPPAALSSMEATEVEPVMVIGRLSQQIETSLRRKREADVISDSITAERLGDLPAANLAEALQRTPGVAIEREVGEGQFVSIRGLGPLFQSVTLNGAPVAFNENIRNSTQSGRQFRFRALSPDLLAGARLTKSSTPDLIEGGIGSNIDIETIGGLDGDPFVSVRVGATGEARTDRFRPETSIAARYVSPSGDWGVVGGLSAEARSVIYDRFQIQRYRDLVINGETVSAPNDVRTTLEQEDRLRRSALLGADARLGDSLDLDVDLLVSTFDNAIREDRLVFGLGERLTAPGSRVQIENGVITGGSVAAGQIDNNTEVSDQDHLNLVLSAGAAIRWGDWRIQPRVSASRARSELDTPLERISGRSPGGMSYAFDVANAAADRRATSLTTAFDVLDPSSLTARRLGVRAIRSVDDDLTALIDGRRAMDWRAMTWGADGLRLSSIRIGAQLSDRSRDYQRRDREAVLRPGETVSANFYALRTPDDVFRAVIRAGPGPWAVADIDRFLQAYYLPGEADGVIVRPEDLAPTGADLQNTYRVGEQVAAAWVRFDFDGTVGGASVFGNFGLRAVGTRTDVQGGVLSVGDDGRAGVEPVTFSGERAALLPSLNLAVDLESDRMLRLALSRTLTRPSLADLRAATVPASTLVSSIYLRGQAEIDDPSPGSIFTGVGGNPELKPYVSSNIDLSWEWTGRRGALSLAVFHKRIDDFVRTVEAPEILTFETLAGPPVRAELIMSRPRNSGRAEVTGLEVGLHRRLPAGFGVWASATLTDSRTRPDDQPLTGVSDLAWSINPFFERGALAVHLSWSWRSAFRSEADMQGGGVSVFTVAPAGYLDAQATLDLPRGAQLIVSGSNLTDTVDVAYEGSSDRLLQLGRVGRSVLIGLRWGF